MEAWSALSRADRLRLTGCTDQVAGVTRMTLEEGRARGSAVYAVETGGGLRYEVTADNGLDIGRLSYRGVNISFMTKNGPVSPFAHHPFEEEFLHTFPGGMLYTCGLLSAGPAGRDADGVWQPLHGRYHSLPADGCFGREEEDGTLRVGGRVRETRLFGHALEVRRSVSSITGGKELVLRDTLENQTPQAMEYMLLYHINFGWPFLSPALRMQLPEGTAARPRDDSAARGSGREREFTGPVDGAAEQVFFHELPAGTGWVRLENPELGFGARVSWSMDTLPVLAQWKCMRSGEYVLGIEPANGYIMGRAGERENGTIGKIGPFETREMEIRLDFYDL